MTIIVPAEPDTWLESYSLRDSELYSRVSVIAWRLDPETLIAEPIIAGALGADCGFLPDLRRPQSPDMAIITPDGETIPYKGEHARRSFDIERKLFEQTHA